MEWSEVGQSGAEWIFLYDMVCKVGMVWYVWK